MCVQQSALGSIGAMDFSPHNAYFAVGNDTGRVALFRLNHYERY
jgi:hypothetical protein